MEHVTQFVTIMSWVFFFIGVFSLGIVLFYPHKLVGDEIWHTRMWSLFSFMFSVILCLVYVLLGVISKC